VTVEAVAVEVAAPRRKRPPVLALLGPAFVAAVAYVDPGNFATNFAAGARHGYSLAWVIVLADLVAMLVQYLTSKAGLATGRSLQQLCAERFGRPVDAVLWVQAEVVAMATDLAEFVGAAIGLNLLFGLPLFVSGLLTGVVSFVLLGLQSRGWRRFEIAITALLLLVAGGFVADLVWLGGPSGGGLAHGLLPTIPGSDALVLAVGIVGATVMPHAIYVHSGLQARRSIGLTGAERRRAARLNVWDCVSGLGAAGLVNLAMLAVAALLAARVRGGGLTDLGSLTVAHEALGRYVGGGAALAFAVALLASGLSSASVGTYAGQVVMAGFMGWKVPLVVRRAVTMVPSLVVLGLGISTTGSLIVSQVVLSFGIPFALVPLLLVTADRTVMGDYVNRRRTTLAAITATVLITALDAVLVVTTF
jgi:manganese transport protein